MVLKVSRASAAYEITIKYKYTFMVGDSGTGKSILIDTLDTQGLMWSLMESLFH